MAFLHLGESEGDEDEGSLLQNRVNRKKTGCTPVVRENRKISGSPPDISYLNTRKYLFANTV